MAKLTDRQRKQIIAEYVNGGISQKKLSTKYGVSQQIISKILKDEKVVKSCNIKKEENTQSMLDFIDSRSEQAQSIMEQILNTSKSWQCLKNILKLYFTYFSLFLSKMRL